MAPFIVVALRRDKPDITATAAIELLIGATGDELAAIWKAFLGLNANKEIHRLVFAAFMGQRSKTKASWVAAIAEVAKSHHWIYSYILTLTLSEFRVAASGAEDDFEDGGVKVENGREQEAWTDFIRRKEAVEGHRNAKSACVEPNHEPADQGWR